MHSREMKGEGGGQNVVCVCVAHGEDLLSFVWPNQECGDVQVCLTIH